MKKLFTGILLSLTLATTPAIADVNLFSNSSKVSKQETQNLVDIIKQNPEGFTLSPYSFTVPKKGYVVAPIKDAEIKIKYSNIDEKHLAEFTETLDQVQDISDFDVYAGGWLNSDDNYYYLDAVYVLDDKNTALYIADAANQIVIYDLGTGIEIDTKQAIKQLKDTNTFSKDKYKQISRDMNKLANQYDLFTKVAA